MDKIKLSTINAATLKDLESKINEYLETEEVAEYKLLSATVREIEERTFVSDEEEFHAVLTFVKNV
ncbi:MAG TPA: hypothetical protein VK115_00755 [Staphylococcus sp.]|nr:hypothetical protein [Staphylococcus sp.]